MKVCYCDETGTGNEPYAVLLGVVVDASRMHVTKSDWTELLTRLSHIVGDQIDELHTRDFYPGNGVWRNLSGQQRSQVIDVVIEWFLGRKHHVVFSAINKGCYNQMRSEGRIYPEIESVWRAMGFHVALAVQKNFQGEKKNKGNTIFIFDKEMKEETHFHALLRNPPQWSDSYYDRKMSRPQLCQLVDVPYFADSRNVSMLQVADFLAYFVRRYIEIEENSVPERYVGEREKIEHWFSQIRTRAIHYQNMYPKRQRCQTADLFWELAPECIRNA